MGELSNCWCTDCMLCCQMSLNTSPEMEDVSQGDEEILLEEMLPLYKIIPPTKISSLDVKEWAMELRENNVSMEELNVRVKIDQMKNTEKTQDRQRKVREDEMDEKEKKIETMRRELEEARIQLEEHVSKQGDIEAREEVATMRHKELLCVKQSLKEKEFELNEKNSKLEIILNMKENLVENETQTFATEKNIAWREKEVARMHQSLDIKEYQIGVQMTEFSHEKKLAMMRVRCQGLGMPPKNAQFYITDLAV